MADKGTQKRRNAPAPSRPPRTSWQRKRDQALAEAGYTKADVHRRVEIAHGTGAVSVQGVRAALDNRYKDDRVRQAFLYLLHGGGFPAAVRDEMLLEYWPAEEPVYRGAGAPK